MSTLDEFKSSPWSKSDQAYDASVINMRPAPEFATAEVVVASLYRAAGFGGHPEGKVPAAGRRLDKASTRNPHTMQGPAFLSPDAWRTIIHGALQSPKQPNQSSKRFLQLSPVVPNVALYSGSARLSGNSWNPGQLVQSMVRIGARTDSSAHELWGDVFIALGVGPRDDIWARWLEQEFNLRRAESHQWTQVPLAEGSIMAEAERSRLRFPAQQFVEDLRAVMDAKECMTRRQWISLLESVIRLATVSHVLWMCDVNHRLWSNVRQVLAGSPATRAETVGSDIFNAKSAYLVYGALALPSVKDMASRYLTARLGINYLLYELREVGAQPPSLRSVSDVASFLEQVELRRDELNARQVLSGVNELVDSQAGAVACRKGIGSNIVEFCRYTLGQRQAADETLRGYDQGYVLRKRAEYSTAPWIVTLGPVALLMLVHCCLAEATGPRSVQRLAEHLRNYGIGTDIDDIAKGDIGRSLRLLGLVLDSPDAESGMLLVPPFPRAARALAAASDRGEAT